MTDHEGPADVIMNPLRPDQQRRVDGMAGFAEQRHDGDATEQRK